MPTYSYKARDTRGKRVKGTIEAATKDEVIDKLRKVGYMATQVTEAIRGFKIEPAFDRLKRISTEDMIVFNVQLANMIKAGITLLTSLNILHKQIGNKRLKEAVGSVVRGISAGDSFSQALAKHPRIFPFIFVNMVKVGEASGELDMILTRYATFYEEQADLQQKIRGALFYPAILFSAGIIVSLLIITFIIPQFVVIFLKGGIKLPLPTLILYKVGIGVKQFWYIGVLLVIVAGWAIKCYRKTPRGKLRIDRLKLKLPIFGSLYRKAAISRFTRTLGTLIASGVPILQSLDIVRGVVGNEVLSRVIANVRTAVERGEGIAASLKISKEFPLDTVQMVSAGEETDKLDSMLDKISDFYDKALGYTIRKLTTILEPLFLVIMGCLIGSIMASIFLPIFDMMKILRR